MKEKERKFLLLQMPEIKNKIEIKQAYLMLDNFSHLRVRIINDDTAYIAFKVFHTSEVRDEYEYQIPVSDANELFHNSKCKLLKTRYTTLFKGNRVDIDVYPDGLSIVEIEYDQELEELPEYCGMEVTGVSKYSNISIAKKQSHDGTTY